MSFMALESEFEGLSCFRETMMPGTSSWMWALVAAVAPGLWCARTILCAFIVDRVAKIVVEKADVRDLPDVLAGLGALAEAVAAPSRPARHQAISSVVEIHEAAARKAGSR
jgi:hypothetical protein